MNRPAGQMCAGDDVLMLGIVVQPCGILPGLHKGWSRVIHSVNSGSSEIHHPVRLCGPCGMLAWYSCCGSEGGGGPQSSWGSLMGLARSGN